MTNKKFKKAISLMMATGMAVSCAAVSSSSVCATADNEASSTTIEQTQSSIFPGNAQLTVGTDKTNRSYELYQIFKGDYADIGDGTYMLTKVEWGDSVSGYSDEVIAALKEKNSTLYGDVKTADDVAAVVKSFNDTNGVTDTDKLDEFAEIVASVMKTKNETEAPRITKTTYDNTSGADSLNYVFGGIADGYYLVNEIPNENNTEKGITYSKYMVNVVGGNEPTLITTKENSGPTISKGILTGEEDNPETKTTDESITNKDDKAVGDTVSFRLDSAVPDMSGYNKYYYVVNDTMAKGLTLNEDSFTVKVGGVTLTKTDNEDADGNTFHVDIDDDKNDDGSQSFKIVLSDFIKYTADSKITITYDATVNKDVVSGNTLENYNTVDLTFSNDPRYEYKGVNEPETDEEGNPVEPTNTTPESSVYVYTGGIELIKVDSKNNRLTGAEFTIRKVKAVTADGTTTYEDDTMNAVLVSTQTHTPIGYASDYASQTENSSSKVYFKLRRGAYTDTLPTTSSSSSYVAAECVKYSKIDDSNYVKDINGSYYKLLTAVDDSSDDSYVAIKPADGEETAADTSKYVSDYVAYERTETPTLMNKEDGTTFTSKVSENGTLILDGLSDGIYEITETKAPEGYNILTDPIYVHVNFNLSNSNEAYWSYWDDTANNTSEINQKKPSAGIYELKIQNTQGSTLPSTGGIGTKIFYIAGTVLVVSAGVLLVTRRRMKKESE